MATLHRPPPPRASARDRGLSPRRRRSPRSSTAARRSASTRSTAGLAERGPRARRTCGTSLLTHIHPTTRARPARSCGDTRASRCTSTRSARPTSSTRRGSSESARRLYGDDVRPAVRADRAGAGGERPRPRRPGASGSRSSRRPGTPAPRLVLRRATAPATRATRLGCLIPPGAFPLPGLGAARDRPRGLGRVARRARGAAPALAAARPLRRGRRSRRAPSAR